LPQDYRQPCLIRMLLPPPLQKEDSTFSFLLSFWAYQCFPSIHRRFKKSYSFPKRKEEHFPFYSRSDFSPGKPYLVSRWSLLSFPKILQFPLKKSGFLLPFPSSNVSPRAPSTPSCFLGDFSFFSPLSDIPLPPSRRPGKGRPPAPADPGKMFPFLLSSILCSGRKVRYDYTLRFIFSSHSQTGLHFPLSKVNSTTPPLFPLLYARARCSSSSFPPQGNHFAFFLLEKQAPPLLLRGTSIPPLLSGKMDSSPLEIRWMTLFFSSYRRKRTPPLSFPQIQCLLSIF